MFPGQGSQYIGMGKEFYEQIPICKEVYDLASEVTGLDIPALCFEENEKINITEYTQICMLATEAAIYMALEQNGYQPDVTAGLSLGEYGALIASGVMTAEEAFELVRKRGIFMQEAVPAGGAMAAVLGLDAAAIEQICRDTAEQTGSEVSIANYNCPGQIVISGQEEAVHLAGETCKASGAKRVVPLKVSGPFHSKMLQGAGEKLKEELKKVEISDSFVPYIANVTADYVTKKEEVKPLLASQVSSSVRWQQTIERLLADGADEFVEIGPGRTLSGFVAAFAGIELGHLVSGKTKVDILVTPIVTIVTGCAVGLIVGPPISKFMTGLGAIINWGTEQQPFIMGIVVSVLMGMILTLPISSAALGIILNLSGLAAGAATIGCCCNMVGFAVASYRENKVAGLLAQGIGTSMLQVPNIVRKPIIWIPAIVSSAVLGPVSTMLVKMTSNATGSGMGTAGFVGQIMTYQTIIIVVFQIVLPAVITLAVSEFMRKKGWIKDGDMKLEL